MARPRGPSPIIPTHTAVQVPARLSAQLGLRVAVPPRGGTLAQPAVEPDLPACEVCGDKPAIRGGMCGECRDALANRSGRFVFDDSICPRCGRPKELGSPQCQTCDLGDSVAEMIDAIPMVP